MLFQNWYYTTPQFPNFGSPYFTWDPTTMSQIISQNDTYQLDIVQHTGNQFKIKIAIHNDIIDLSKKQTYHDEIVGPADYVIWYVNLTAGQDLIIDFTSENYSLSLTFINPPYSDHVLNSIISSHVDYMVLYNGTYELKVSGLGKQGPFSLTFLIKEPSNNENNSISLFNLVLLTVIAVILFSITYIVLKKARSGRKNK